MTLEPCPKCNGPATVTRVHVTPHSAASDAAGCLACKTWVLGDDPASAAEAWNLTVRQRDMPMLCDTCTPPVTLTVAQTGLGPAARFAIFCNECETPKGPWVAGRTQAVISFYRQRAAVMQ